MAFNSCYDDNISSEFLTATAWSSSEFPRQYRVNGVIMAVILTMFLVTGASLNLAVITSIIRKKLLSQPTFLLLLNLSVADLLFCVTVMPFHIVTGFAGEFVFGGSDLVRCRVCSVGIALIILAYSSLHSVALISVDRLLFIKRPLHYHKTVTFHRVLAAIFLTWIVCLALSVPPLFGFGQIRYAHSLSHCLTSIHSNNAYIYLMVGEALLPLLALIISSLWVARIAKKQIKLVHSSSLLLDRNPTTSQELEATRHARRKKSKLQFHLFRVFGAIIVANFLTWVPALIFAAMGTFLNRDEIPLEYKTFSYLCLLFQPVIHPALEASLISDIQFPLLKQMQHFCESRLPHNEEGTCCSRFGLGIGFNGLEIGATYGTCSCRVCGLLDMCSAAAIMSHTESDDSEVVGGSN